MSETEFLIFVITKIVNGIRYLLEAPWHEIEPFFWRGVWYLFLFWLLQLSWKKWKKAGKK